MSHKANIRKKYYNSCHTRLPFVRITCHTRLPFAWSTVTVVTQGYTIRKKYCNSCHTRLKFVRSTVTVVTQGHTAIFITEPLSYACSHSAHMTTLKDLPAFNTNSRWGHNCFKIFNSNSLSCTSLTKSYYRNKIYHKLSSEYSEHDNL